MEKSKIEKRIAELEKEVAVLRKQVEDLRGTDPWWERIAGTFQDDPIYKRAMALGRKYRRAQRSNGAE